jgi:capsular exopolysaccharide synthesis family protein
MKQDEQSSSLPARRSAGQILPPTNYRQEVEDPWQMNLPPAPLDPAGKRPALSLRDALFRQKWTIAALALAGLVAGFVATRVMTPLYEARLVLEIQQLNENFMNGREMMPVSGEDRSPLISDVLTQLRVLGSEHLLQRVLERNPELHQHVEKVVGKPGVPARPEDVQAYLKDALQMRSDPQTRIVDLTLTERDPAFAAGFLNALAREYVSENIERRSEMTRKTADWLRRQVEDSRVRIERADDDLQRYARASQLLFTSGHQSVAEEKLRQLQDALSKAQADRIEREAHYQMVRDGKSNTPEMLADATLRDYAQRLEDLRRQKAEMGVTYTPDYSKMKRLEMQIAALESTFDRARSGYLGAMKKDYEQALLREKMLLANYTTQSKLVNDEAAKTVRYDLMKHEGDSLRQSYESMLQRLKEVSMASAMQVSNIRVVDPAQVPFRPSKPKAPLNMLIGLITGLMAGAAYALWRELSDTRVRAPGELSAMLRMPELGAIPKAPVRGHVSDGGLPRRPVLSLMIESSTSEPRSRSERNRLVLATAQESLLIDSCRSVLTSLFASGRVPVPRKLTVSSVMRGEGKTTVTCNLGVTMAKWRKRVLLIDGDFRRPQLHGYFGTPNENGLSDLLDTPAAELPEKLAQSVRPGSVDGLFFIPSGARSEQLTDRLSIESLRPIIDAAGEMYDLILIDTPPALSFSDARLFGRVSDGVILVARAQQTETAALSSVVDRLLDDGSVILGTILNDWDIQGDRRYMRYYRSSYAS